VVLTESGRSERAKNDDGLVLVMVSLLLLVMMVSAALVVDLGNARVVARRSQASADAAALAAARELPLSTSQAADPTFENKARAEAMGYVIRNVFETNTPAVPTCPSAADTCTATVQDVTITITTPYTGLSGFNPFNLVYVKICEPTAEFFAGGFGGSSPTVCREAVARRLNTTGGYGFGLVALDPDDCRALQFSGSSDTILSSNGAVMVNSACSNTVTGALDASGSNWHLTASFIGVVGTATLAPCDPDVTDDCTATEPTRVNSFTDPLGSVTEPTETTPVRSCTGTVTGSVEFFEPGYYPNSCTFSSNRTYAFAPGVYTFNNGFSSSGSASMVCLNTATSTACDAGIGGVAFFIKGGTVTMNGSGRVNLPAPRSGPYEGISIFQSRTNTNLMTINGTNDFLLGTVYAPNALIKATGSGGSSAINIEGLVVGNTVDISGSFSFNINVPEDSPAAPTDDDVGLEV
jgi:hypothetical protein